MASTPKQNTEFWIKKFAVNLRRDGLVYYQLKVLGWRTAIIWECAIRDKQHLADYIETLTLWLKSECEYLEVPDMLYRLEQV
ncbi:hypothetical protein [Methyloprofundus sp.]|uniref:hypothetical protein n=1 Tax=Methyloprofundus sp. TaxID=2020875 RepID=UPI003D0FAF36